MWRRVELMLRAGLSGPARGAALVSGGLQPAVRVALVCALFAFADATLHACPICFQVEDTNAVNGVRAGVLVLMSVTSAVLVGFAMFAARVARSQSSTEPLNPGTEEPRNRQ